MSAKTDKKVSESDSINTRVLACHCSSNAQDRIYQPGKRLHNQTHGKAGAGAYRCTVCSTVRTAA